MLEEALYSFLQQDYPDDKRELVIVNDYPLQRLIFEHPLVRIFNLGTTFSTLGEKENFATEQCKGEIICQWDDDDCELSNHLSNVEKYFKEDTALLQWQKGIYYNEPEITAITGIGNAGMVYSKKAWKESGGYPIENCGHDMSFVMKLKKLYPDKYINAAPPDDEVSFMYMWGGRGYHASGQGTDTPDRPNIIQRHTEYIEGLRKRGKIPTGDVVLKPHWKKPYDEILTKFVNK